MENRTRATDTTVIRRRKRSLAWIYYAIITALLAYAQIQHVPHAWAAALVSAAYSTYLFRGGRFVIWIW